MISWFEISKVYEIGFSKDKAIKKLVSKRVRG